MDFERPTSNHELNRQAAQRLSSGDGTGISDLLAEHGRSLVAAAQRITGSRASAEDVVQDLFVSVWQRPHGYDPERGGINTWLHLRCRSMALDRVRSETSRRRREHRTPCVVGELHRDRYPSADAPIDLRAALADLSHSDRHLIELAFFDGLTYGAAAESIGIPEGTAKARIRRILASLKVDLDQREAVAASRW